MMTTKSKTLRKTIRTATKALMAGNLDTARRAVVTGMSYAGIKLGRAPRAESVELAALIECLSLKVQTLETDADTRRIILSA